MGRRIIDAPAAWAPRATLDQVLAEHRELSADGFPIARGPKRRIAEEEFVRAQAWFLTFATPSTKLWDRYTSYFIKHRAERWAFAYVANGAAIAAARSLGINVEQEWPGSPNGLMRAVFRKTPRPLPALLELDRGEAADDLAIAVAATHALAEVAGVDAGSLWRALDKPQGRKPPRAETKNTTPWGPPSLRMPLRQAFGVALRSEAHRR